MVKLVIYKDYVRGKRSTVSWLGESVALKEESKWGDQQVREDTLEYLYWKTQEVCLR